MGDRSIPQRSRRVRLRDLETLVAVVQAGGMRKAAAELNLSQPAVSKAMQELEAAIGVRLLERSRRGAEATVPGQALVRRAKTVLDELHNALLELDWLSDPEGGEVRVGGGDTQQAGVLATVARSVLARHPRMQIRFESAQADELLGLLLPQRLVDMAVIRPMVEALPADLVGEPLYHEQLHVVCGPGHPLAGRRRLPLAALVDECWILSRNERMAGSPVLQAFAAADLPAPARVIESGTLSLRQSLLLNSRCITCVPHTIVPLVRRQSLCLLPVELPRWSAPTMLITLRGRVPGPACEVFQQALRDAAQSLRLS